MLNAMATSLFSPCFSQSSFTSEHALMMVKSGLKPTSSSRVFGRRHVGHKVLLPRELVDKAHVLLRLWVGPAVAVKT